MDSQVPVATYPSGGKSRYFAPITWNVVAIVIGVLIAMVGGGAGFSPEFDPSAAESIVAALWIVAGVIGLLIAAVGLAGATVIHAIKISSAQS